MATRVSDIRKAQAPATLEHDDDKVLVLAFQAGDTAAYADIFVKYRALASQICYRILQDREEADEAVQETMLRVYRGLPRFNGRYQLQAWVARIATNVSLDMIRARQRRPQRADALPDISEELHAEVVSLGEDTSEVIERVLDQEHVRSTLSAIPEHHREALVLREFEGRSHEEIGDALGVSPTQAKALIHRAKKSFRRAWGEDGEHRGLAAFAPILLAPFRLPGLLRKLVEPARDVMTSAAATAQQAAVQVAASPAAAQTTLSIGDKVTAAALTVLVAGTVSVGAVAIKHAAAPAKAAPVSASPAVAPSVPPPAAVVPAVHPRKAAVKPHKHHHAVHTGPGGQTSPSSTPSPTTSPSSEPTESPSPGGSVTPPPPPPPAPAWSGSFTSSVGLSAAHLVEVAQHVVADGSIFEETVQGDLVGPKGKSIGSVYVDFAGSKTPTSGHLSSLWLWVNAPEGQYRYAANGTLTSVGQAPDGSTTYVFSGDYTLSTLPATLTTDVPHDGSIAITLRFWSDGTLISTGVSMTDA